ncbi:hypothetical protein, partial [Vibrio rotiferianus]|uniref:hypothetical protein n=1 Tax=Vibrio rotiferianus TaxID=190895 RepID=UPI0005EF6D87
SIPKEVWGAAIDIVNMLVYPITATTMGVGKLIEQKFETLNDVQKVIAEQTLREATEKVKKASQKTLIMLLLNLRSSMRFWKVRRVKRMSLPVHFGQI